MLVKIDPLDDHHKLPCFPCQLPEGGSGESLTFGFATFSFMWRGEVPSSFCSPSTPFFIRASVRFLSRGTVYCCPQAGAIPIVEQRRKGISATAEPKEQCLYRLLLEEMFQFIPRLPPSQPVPTAFLTDLQWAPLG